MVLSLACQRWLVYSVLSIFVVFSLFVLPADKNART